MSAIKPSFRVQISNTGREAQVPGQKDLLSELGLTTARGAVVEGCRGGGCGICRIRVLRGDYVTGVMSKSEVPDEEAAQGYALACKLTAKSDLEIEALGKRFFCKSKAPVVVKPFEARTPVRALIPSESNADE